MKKTIILCVAALQYLFCTAQNVGIGVLSPTDKLHINSAVGEDALRVQVNSATKLRVWSNGGVSIGSPVTPLANGLYVSGGIQPQNGIQTAAKMIIESTADSIVVKAGGSEVIIAANGNITIRSGGSSILNIESGGSLNLTAGTSINLSASTGVNINASTSVTIGASTHVAINGSQIRLNGSSRQVARVGDTVNGAQILTGNSSVLTN